jgi:hypothetical protein
MQLVELRKQKSLASVLLTSCAVHELVAVDSMAFPMLCMQRSSEVSMDTKVAELLRSAIKLEKAKSMELAAREEEQLSSLKVQ